MDECEGVAGALEERRQWLTQAAEQAEKDRAHAESQVQAAKKSLASENDIRVGSREVRCSLFMPSMAQHAPTASPNISCTHILMCSYLVVVTCHSTGCREALCIPSRAA